MKDEYEPLLRAIKGTPQYEKWLRAYLEKRNRKLNEDCRKDYVKETTLDILSSSRALAKIDKALSVAGTEARSIFDVLSRCSSAVQKGTERSVAVKEQINALTEAFNGGLDLDSLDLSYVRHKDVEGAESFLYLDENDPSFVIKVVDYSVQSATPFDYLLDRVVLHNTMFPETAYQVHGFGFDASGRLRFVVSQQIIKGERAPLESIEAAMNARGFTRDELNLDWFENEEFRILDVHDRNALIDSRGTVFFIDEVIERKSR